ncbi:MAG: hypothetical protein AB7S55_00710 [Thiomonas sp.]
MSIDLLISRLQKPRKAPARSSSGITRAYRSHCPLCGGHGLPLSIAETSDGRILLHCFGGCATENILSSVGLTWDDVLPPRPAAHHAAGNAGPTEWGALFCALDALQQAHCALLAACTTAEINTAAALTALLDAGAAMQHVRDMARRAMRDMREGGQA